MRVYDYSAAAGSKSGGLTDALGKVSLSFGSKGPEVKVVVADTLRKLLDNNHYLLLDVSLDGLDVPVPGILVGPTGLWVLYLSDAKGVYRVDEDTWDVLDSKTQKFKASRPNLVKLTSLMAQVVSDYLSGKNLSVSEISPMLFFADPGVHVDASRPIVRIVLADALDRFAAGLVRGRPSMNPMIIQSIVNVLGGDPALKIEAEEVVDKKDIFSFQELPEEKASRPSPLSGKVEEEPDVFKRISFSRRQWFLLGALIVFNIIVLIIFVVVLLISI